MRLLRYTDTRWRHKFKRLIARSNKVFFTPERQLEDKSTIRSIVKSGCYLLIDSMVPEYREDKVIVGYVAYSSYVNDAGQPEGWTYKTYVRPEYRHHGYASLLLSAALGDLKYKRGCRTAWCDVDSNNIPMLTLKFKQGYEIYDILSWGQGHQWLRLRKEL